MSEWKTSPLGGLTSFLGRGKSPVYANENEIMPMPVLNQACVQHGRLDLSKLKFVTRRFWESLPLERRLQPGDVLINSTGTGTLGRIGFWNEGMEATFDSHVTALRFPEEHCSRFFYHLLSTERCRSIIEGDCTSGSTNQVELLREQLKRVQLRHPSDKHEQQTITKVLSKIDEAIVQTEALLAKQQRIKTGLMHDLLTCGLDAQGRLRNPSIHRFRKSIFGMIPEEWRPSNAGAECDQICVGIVIRPSQYYSETGVVALRSMNVQPGFFDLSEVVRISHEANASLSKSRLKAGDVVTVRTGEPGTSAVVTSDLESCNCIDLVISRPSKSLRPHFLAVWMNSAFAVEHVLQNQGGLAQQHFNVGEMKKMPIPIPSIDEQDRIMERTAAVEQTANKIEASLAKLRRLKIGLMHDLLTGERSVTPLLTNSRS